MRGLHALKRSTPAACTTANRYDGKIQKSQRFAPPTWPDSSVRRVNLQKAHVLRRTDRAPILRRTDRAGLVCRNVASVRAPIGTTANRYDGQAVRWSVPACGGQHIPLCFLRESRAANWRGRFTTKKSAGTWRPSLEHWGAAHPLAQCVCF